MTTQLDTPPTQESAVDYDAVPYESHPYWQSSPDWLGAIAVLFGLSCTPPESARVLELGCAAGGNLIPHAARNPQGEYVGVDYSRVQIQDGQQRIDHLGLSNITLLHASVAALPEDLGTFDYIIVHGVYSWVAPDIQEAILRACKTHLRPNGIAYVSYNIYPGWKTREIMRDAMLFHTRLIEDPSQRLGHAKGMVEYMQQIGRPGSMFKQVMDAEVDVVSKGSPSYLVHEYLEEHNSPCYFREFAARALHHGLAYLGDGTLPTMFPSNLGGDAAQRLANVAHNQIDLEQYLDFLSNRTFRQSLLVHGDAQAKLRRNLGREQLSQLAYYGGFFPVKQENGEPVSPAAWTSTWGNTIQPASTTHRRVVEVVGAAYPGSVSAAALEQIARESAAADKQTPEAAIEDLYALLRTLVSRGLLRISTKAREIVRSSSTHPVADWLARRDAETGRALTTGIVHDLIQLNIIELLILPLLDGTNDHASLVNHLIAAEGDGRLQFFDKDKQFIKGEEAVRKCAEDHLEHTLRGLSARGLMTA
jgi:methyltransferase-like protein